MLLFSYVLQSEKETTEPLHQKGNSMGIVHFIIVETFQHIYWENPGTGAAKQTYLSTVRLRTLEIKWTEELSMVKFQFSPANLSLYQTGAQEISCIKSTTHPLYFNNLL